MSKINEVSHKSSGGFDPILTLFTAGAGALTALTSEVHEVVVENERGQLGVGTGSTRTEARREAIRDLNN